MIGFSKAFDDISKKSLFLVEGEEWRDQKRLIHPAFQFTHIKNQIPKFNMIANRFVSQLGAIDGPVEVFYFLFLFFSSSLFSFFFFLLSLFSSFFSSPCTPFFSFNFIPYIPSLPPPPSLSSPPRSLSLLSFVLLPPLLLLQDDTLDIKSDPRWSFYGWVRNRYGCIIR